MSLREAEDAEGRAAAEDALRRLAEKEQLQYAAEMAKIIYREPGSGRARVSEIDISEPILALRFLRLLDYILMVHCFGLIVGSLLAPIYDPVYRQGLPLLFYLLIITIPFFVLLTGFRNVGVIDERVWGAYLFALPPLILLHIPAAVGGIAIAAVVVEGPFYPPPLVALYLVVYDAFHLLLAAVGVIAVFQLRRMRVTPLGIPLGRLLSELRGRGEPFRGGSGAVRRVNKLKGTLLAGAGAVVILFGVLVLAWTAANEPADWGGHLFSLYVEAGGCLLLLSSRRYFQVEADSLLAVDRRSPILFLRSFADDKRPTYRDALQQILDFSLETRLSNHFRRFGPFIAVGSPAEKAPVPGAARVALSNREWLSRVEDWMAEASLIVMYAGKTDWVNWELAKVIETGRVNSLILIIPEAGWLGPAVRARLLSRRFERLSEVFEGTRWSDSLTKLHDLEVIRAMLFRDDGSLLVMRSQPRGRDSHHLAALVAHYLMLEHAVGKSEI